MECFETIIGLVPQAGCHEGYEDEYSDSKSGLFLSDLPGITLVNACGLDMFSLMIRARLNAVQTVRTDLYQEATKYIRPARVPFNGDIGGSQFARTENTDGAYGMRVYSSIAGARILFTGITYLPFDNQDKTLSIYDDFELIDTVEITGVTARRPLRVTFDEAYLMDSGNLYFIITGDNAYSGKMFCCGKGKNWCFDMDKPCYNSAGRSWMAWAMAAGIHGADASERQSWRKFSRNIGMVLHASFDCNIDSLLCNGASDFLHRETDRAFAFALWYKTGELFLNAAIDSGEVNRYTLLAGEALDFRRQEYMDKYRQMLTWLAGNINTSANDCFTCNPRSIVTNRYQISYDN